MKPCLKAEGGRDLLRFVQGCLHKALATAEEDSSRAEPKVCVRYHHILDPVFKRDVCACEYKTQKRVADTKDVPCSATTQSSWGNRYTVVIPSRDGSLLSVGIVVEEE